MVQRYNPDYVMHAARFAPFAREAEHGEFVKFSDYEVLKAERDALADRVERLSGMLTESMAATKSAEERADALEVRLRNALSSEQEAIQRAHAANQTADALAVENVALKQSEVPLGAIENGRAFADRLEAYPFECQGGSLSMCSDWQELRRCFDHLSEWAMHGQSETPASDAALAAIQAQGVEKFADMCREKSKLATTADSCAGWSNCSVHASSFAIRLREAK
ncbi:TPA: hypothetical protein ACKP8U_001497 [Serratia marcescens]|uniref:hypothetical protein n=1 Tax=Serratia marcescens TaxID=615 RepID=UPI002FE62EC4